MKLRLVVALAALLPSVAGGFGGGRGLVVPLQPALYELDGYLDQAPNDATVLEKFYLSGHGRERLFLLTAYRRLGSGNPWALVRDLRVYYSRLILQGPSAAVDRILDAPAGSRIRGTFQHLAGDHSLLVNQHDLKVEPAAERSAAPE